MRGPCPGLLWRPVATGLVILALGTARAPAAGQERAPAQATEYEAKAAFIYNFSLYVQWPDSAFERTGDRFVVGVVGHDPFGGLLERLLNGEPVDKRTIQVRRFASPEAVQDVHILFVGSPESAGPRLAAALGNKAVLTVGETPGFAETDGIIGLRVESGKVRLDVNRRRAEAAGLRISSQLLKLARLVGGGD